MHNVSMEDPVVYAPESQPPYIYPPYRSSLNRGPRQAPIPITPTSTESSGPDFSAALPETADLTGGHRGAPIGERIIVTGQISDAGGRSVPHTVLELWQCNAAGRYRHVNDQHDAPLDPNFTGSGRLRADSTGRFRFVTIRPGAYPWRNHPNAWRPAHIHFSLLGPAFANRLVTQMYFPGDPLLAFDPIFHSVSNHAARDRLVARFDHARAEPEYALAYRFDIVLNGPAATPWQTPP
ncbi:MAG: protocatechuate 3,4-dioxygenase subunit beta [Gammaproteobacteria bacterium]